MVRAAGEVRNCSGLDSSIVSGDIFLQHGEDEPIPMSEAPYDTEDVLQELLAKFPHLLAGDQYSGDEPRRWLLIKREVGVPDDDDASDRFSLDHLFLDQDAVPTLVEVKRSSDTRIRREVVGQLIDYAANGVVYWPTEKLRALFEARLEDEGRDPEAELAAVLGPDGDADAFWKQATDNLKTGRVRMIFVADEIPRELQRVVEFLNEQMTAEVIAIEVKQYPGPDGLRVLVPRVIGQTAAAEVRKGEARKRRQWDEESFLAELEREHGADAARVGRELIDWARSKDWHDWWGKGAVNGSFRPWFEHAGRERWPLALWTEGSVEIGFSDMAEGPAFGDVELRREFLRRLNEIEGVSIPEDKIDGAPTIDLNLLASDEALDSIKTTLDWYNETVLAVPAEATAEGG